MANGEVYYEYGNDLTNFTTPISDTVQILSQAQGGLALKDIEGFTEIYWGPSAGVECLLFQQNHLIFMDLKTEEKVAYSLVMAVRRFGFRLLQWEALIRRLIREGVDIHGTTRSRLDEPRCYADEREASYVLGTPLDELFVFTVTLSDARSTSTAWLQILASEGINILEYLKTEYALHTPRQ